MLKGKTILLGLSGSISAFKMAHLASLLKQAGADTYVIMTKNACRFIDPVVFDTLTGHRTVLDDFDRTNLSPVSHIDLPKMADVFLVAPASADIIGKAANGIADDCRRILRSCRAAAGLWCSPARDSRPAGTSGTAVCRSRRN